MREALIEGIVVADDDMMERYLEGEVPSTKELEATLAHGIASATVFPVVCGSAVTGVGIDRLASLHLRDRAEPARPAARHDPRRRPADRGGPGPGRPAARAGSSRRSWTPSSGGSRCSRCSRARCGPTACCIDSRNHAEERLHALQLMRGKETEPIAEAVAGDLVAVAKLTDVRTGDTLAPKSQPVVVDGPPMPAPVLSIAVRPKAKGDEDKLMTALHRLQEEDLGLAVRRDDETHQTVLSGMGDTHLQIVCEKLRRKFSVDVETEPLVVPFRETISRHRPRPRASTRSRPAATASTASPACASSPSSGARASEFADEIVGGAIPRQFIPAVEKGIQEAMAQGGVFGFPVVDVKVTCFDGKYHSVDSSEMSFKMAASIGFKEALAAAGPVLLEPVSRLEVTVPANYQGDVLGDLNARRGRVLGTEAGDRDEQVVIALVPTSEVQRYATDLRSLTGGRGRFTIAHDHHEVVPQQVADRLVKQATHS